MCREVKDISEFRYMTHRGLYSSYCKNCERIYNAEYKRLKRELDRSMIQRIKDFLKESNITIEEAAGVLNVPAITFQKMLYCDRVFTLEMFRNVCESFNLSADYLLFGEKRGK